MPPVDAKKVLEQKTREHIREKEHLAAAQRELAEVQQRSQCADPTSHDFEKQLQAHAVGSSRVAVLRIRAERAAEAEAQARTDLATLQHGALLDGVRTANGRIVAAAQRFEELVAEARARLVAGLQDLAKEFASGSDAYALLPMEVREAVQAPQSLPQLGILFDGTGEPFAAAQRIVLGNLLRSVAASPARR